ncbi:MAG: TraB/GumN family protein [Cytophagales bacterium]|nr:TraB/GumN family protein [Cytophagales bacterium]
MKKLLFLTFFLFAGLIAHSQSSVLWEITRNDMATPSYIMGTLKFIGEKEFYLPKEVASSMATCKTFAIEDQVDHKSQMELNKAVHYPKGKSLATELSPEDYNKVLRFFASEFQIPKSKFEKELGHLIPLALSMNMTRMSLGEKVKYYDIELLKMAKDYKLKAYSLESIEREAKALQAFPLKDQELALIHSVENFETQKSEYLKLEAAYVQGDLEKVFEYSLHPTENNAVFINDFYTVRNLEWFPKIEKMIHEKPAFIAVGVTHLEGEKGILKMLKDKGYTLTSLPVKR